jgi:hypothetical protein
VPEAERTAPIMNLVELVHDGVDESQVSFAEIVLCDAQGAPLLDPAGKQITRRLKHCQLSPRCARDVPDDKRCEAGATCVSDVCVRPGTEVIRDETQRTACQRLFFDVTACRPDPKASDPKQLACANEAIASWIVSNLNGDALDPEKAIVVVREATLVDAAGTPIAGKHGPIVRQLAACDKLTGTERESCRALFVELSTCRIKPHDVADCTAEKAACVQAAVDACSRDAIASWAEENESLYKE